ncbi:MAG: cellulase family glycosylhydrolase [Anaerolineales bacterium]|nr:cellulase family glycosylhydrolase [Anaerolineales bacterium]
MTEKRWSVEKATEWYQTQPWLRGCNFIPSTAINQLEMWQAESFDLDTIDRELNWAAELGFNAMRVYLHDLVWIQDRKSFKERIDQYLAVSDRHGIKTILVLFDDCWHDDPKLGAQPDPRPGVHNSGWVKGPGTSVLKDRSQWGRLKAYVTDIVGAYGQDDRVVVWDIYNEPGNNFLVSLNAPAWLRYPLIIGKLISHLLAPGPTLQLLRESFSWARDAGPNQPLTAGLYFLRPFLGAKLNPVCLELSDIVTFHSYFNLEETFKIVTSLEMNGRPMICTEYLARTEGSTFQTILPFFKSRKIGGINWGLVAGKTQTMYSWEDYYPDGQEPPLWFHDILRADGSPYSQEEKTLIQEICLGEGF